MKISAQGEAAADQEGGHPMDWSKPTEISDVQLAFPASVIGTQKVHRHISACLGSYEPKHEHKIAGVAYLLSLWFEPVA